MTDKKIEIRLVITPKDPLYSLFVEIKSKTALRSNVELARLCIGLALDTLKDTSKNLGNQNNSSFTQSNPLLNKNQREPH